jgi:serine/threonine-protein phosphatase 6 regulatory ankyrin repeat subunit B
MKVSTKLVLKAAENGDLEYLNKVVDTDYGFDKSLDWMTQVDKKGRAPLHLSSMNGHIYIIRLIWRIITEFTRDIYARARYLDVVDHKGRTPLFHAAAGGYLNICTYLVDRHANTDIYTNENHTSPGSTALMACAEKNNVDCFKMLSRKGADVMITRRDGADAIYMAARYGNHEIVRLIATNNMFTLIVNRKSFYGRTALITAAIHGHLEACEILYANGFDLDDQDNDKFSALIHATNGGHYLLVKWLVTSGANLYLKDRYGATAWDIAVTNSFPDIAGFLLESQENLERGKNTSRAMRGSINRLISRVKVTYSEKEMGRFRRQR